MLRFGGAYFFALFHIPYYEDKGQPECAENLSAVFA